MAKSLIPAGGMLVKYNSLARLRIKYLKIQAENNISEDSVHRNRGREDRGASRTPLPEIGFMLGSATTR